MRIAICGKMCSGKTSLANMIQRMDSRYKIISLGSKVKDIGVNLFNMKYKDRELLISIGTKMRAIDNDIWIKYLLKDNQHEDYLIIDDLRYQNEYNYLIQEGFQIIQLHISKDTQQERLIKLYPNNYREHLKYIDHESEKNIFQWNINHKPILEISEYSDYHKIQQQIFALLQKKENNH